MYTLTANELDLNKNAELVNIGFVFTLNGEKNKSDEMLDLMISSFIK